MSEKPTPPRTRSHHRVPRTPEQHLADAHVRNNLKQYGHSARQRTETAGTGERRRRLTTGQKVALLGAGAVTAFLGVNQVREASENPYDVKPKVVAEAQNMTSEQLAEAGLERVIVMPGDTLGATADRYMAGEGIEQTIENRDHVIDEITDQARAHDGDTTQHPGDVYFLPDVGAADVGPQVGSGQGGLPTAPTP